MHSLAAFFFCLHYVEKQEIYPAHSVELEASQQTKLGAPAEVYFCPAEACLMSFQEPLPELSEILEREKRVPWIKILCLLVMLSSLVVLSIAKGGTTGNYHCTIPTLSLISSLIWLTTGKSPLGVRACSKSYWGLVWLPFALLLLSCSAAVWYLIAVESKKVELNYPYRVLSSLKRRFGS